MGDRIQVPLKLADFDVVDTGLVGGVLEVTVVSTFPRRVFTVGRPMLLVMAVAGGGMWTELGDAAVYEQTQARQLLLYALDDLGEAINKELADYLDKKPPTIIKQLHGLERDGLVIQDTKGGPWRRTTNPANSPNHDDSELGRLAGLGDLWDEEE